MSRARSHLTAATGESASGMAKPGSLRAHWRAVCGTCRQIFGIPDYESYLAHAAARHPGAPVLTRGDYFRCAIERRYGKGGMRCC